MPKKSEPKVVGTSAINGVSVDLLELKATKKDDKDAVTSFTYQFPRFKDDAKLEDVVKALAYTNSKKELVSGESVLLDYVNVALKNEKRSQKLAEITGILKLREDPEKAIQNMVDQMVLAYGVPREVAENNVRALVAMGTNAPATS